MSKAYHTNKVLMVHLYTTKISNSTYGGQVYFVESEILHLSSLTHSYLLGVIAISWSNHIAIKEYDNINYIFASLISYRSSR